MAHFSVNSVCHNLLVGTSLTLTYKLQAPLHNYTAAKKKKELRLLLETASSFRDGRLRWIRIPPKVLRWSRLVQS